MSFLQNSQCSVFQLFLNSGKFQSEFPMDYCTRFSTYISCHGKHRVKVKIKGQWLVTKMGPNGLALSLIFPDISLNGTNSSCERCNLVLGLFAQAHWLTLKSVKLKYH